MENLKNLRSQIVVVLGANLVQSSYALYTLYTFVFLYTLPYCKNVTKQSRPTRCALTPWYHQGKALDWWCNRERRKKLKKRRSRVAVGSDTSSGTSSESERKHQMVGALKLKWDYISYILHIYRYKQFYNFWYIFYYFSFLV